MIYRSGFIDQCGAWAVESARDDDSTPMEAFDVDGNAVPVSVADGVAVSPATKTRGDEPLRAARAGDQKQAIIETSDLDAWPDGRVFAPTIARRLEAGETIEPKRYANEWTRAEPSDVLQLVEVVNRYLTYQWADPSTLHAQPFHHRTAREAWQRENPNKTPTRETVGGLLARLAGRMLTEPLSIAEDIGLFNVADVNPDQWEDDGGLYLDMRLAEALEHYGGKGRTKAEAIRKSARKRWKAYQKHPEQVAPLWALWIDPTEYPAPARWLAVLADCLLADVNHEAKQLDRVTKATKPQAPERWPMSVDSTAVRVQTGLSGGVLSEHQRGHLEAQGINRVGIRWEDGEQLELDFYKGIDPLAAVAHKYGPRALNDLQTALILQFNSWNDDPHQAFPWWPNEHAAMQGSEAGRHRDLFKMIERLSGSILTAYYEDGETMEDPILSLHSPLRNKRGSIIGAYMRIHPALSRGFFGPGKRQYWPQPVGMVKALNRPDGTGRHVGALAVVVAQQFNIDKIRKKRTPERVEARFKARTLADRLGLSWRTDGARDTRKGDTLKANIDTAVEVGVIGSYDVEGGDLADPDAVVVMRPHFEVLKPGAHIQHAPKIPATGRELEAWVEQRIENGDKKVQVAASLNVTPRALRGAMKRGDRLLTASIRTALREYLHPEPEPDSKA